MHIIIHPTYDRRKNLDHMLAQLEKEPVNVHLIPGKIGHIGYGRAKGFSAGSEEIVSYVDDDDVIIPGIFEKLLNQFESDNSLDAICTNELIWNPNEFFQSVFPWKYYDRRHVYHIHHLAAFKRNKIVPYLPEIATMVDGSEHSLWMRLLLESAKVLNLCEYGYIWRIHPQDSKSLKLTKDARFDLWYKQLFMMAQQENFVPHIKSNRLHTQEEMQQCQNQFQMLQSFLKNLELSYPA